MLQFETKDRLAKVERKQNVDVVSIFSKKTGKLLQTYYVTSLPQVTSYTALVQYAKAHQLSLSASEQSEGSESLEDCADNGKPNVPESSTIPGDTLFIDVETTGLGYRDEIIEIAIIDSSERVLLNTLVKPTRPIPKESIKIHGITNDMVKDAPSFLDVWKKILKIVKGKVLYFYNANFDCRQILQSFGTPFKSRDMISYPSMFKCSSVNCLMMEYADYWGDYDPYHHSNRWQSLLDACSQQKIDCEGIPNHRALGDAIKTRRLWSVRDKWTHLLF